MIASRRLLDARRTGVRGDDLEAEWGQIIMDESAEFAVVIDHEHACGTFRRHATRIAHAGWLRRNFNASLTILRAFQHTGLTSRVSIPSRKEQQS